MARSRGRQMNALAVAMLKKGVTGQTGTLDAIAQKVLRKKEGIEALAKKHPTPFFVIDEEELKESATSFLKAFSKHIPSFEAYYAVKSNNHPEILKRVLKHGLGLDVSSGWELEKALALKAKKIVFTGPGKSLAELEMAVRHADRVIINIDSFRELEKLDAITRRIKKHVRAGVRVNTKIHGQWNKFGISITELGQFWKKSEQCKYIHVQGIQAHMSKNKNADPYVAFLKELAGYLKNDLSEKQRKSITYIDIGGGFMPYQSFAYYPWVQPQGTVIKAVNDFFDKPSNFIQKYFIKEAVPVEEYASEIGKAMTKYIYPLVACALYAEPGRFVCHKSMMIVTKVVDVKRPGHAITDGGINMLGWERFEFEYYPVVNLTHPAKKEISFRLNGPLCTPLDHWGNYCYAKKVSEDDLIVISNQGAYSFTSAHDFIKPIPEVYILK